MPGNNPIGSAAEDPMMQSLHCITEARMLKLALACCQRLGIRLLLVGLCLRVTRDRSHTTTLAGKPSFLAFSEIAQQSLQPYVTVLLVTTASVKSTRGQPQLAVY